jgi:hypothetical protein
MLDKTEKENVDFVHSKNTLTKVLAYVQAWFFVGFVWSKFARDKIELVLNFAPVKIVSWFRFVHPDLITQIL